MTGVQTCALPIYINLILTTNFDPLIVQGLAYANVRPYIYDVANLLHFDSPQVRTPAVLYLHGQFGAFVNVHSEAEAKRLRERVQQIYDAFLGNHTFIVVGYAGDDRDPVFSELCKRYQFTSGLFWVHHSDTEPTPHVYRGLLEDETKSTSYIHAQPADVFFARLVAALKIVSTNLSRRPFTFLSEALAHVAPLKTEETDEDLTRETRQWVADAQMCFEANEPCRRYRAEREEFIKQDIVKRAREAWLEQRFDALDSLLAEAAKEQATEAYGYLASAFLMLGMQLMDESDQAPSDVRAQKLREAGERLGKATELNPSNSGAFFLWGVALYYLSSLLPKDEAMATLRDASAKLRSATEIRLDYGAAFLFWGGVLTLLSSLVDEAERPNLLAQAEHALMLADKIKPGSSDYSLACVAALKGDKKKALALLDRALADGQTPVEFALKDKNLMSLHNTPEWQPLIDKYTEKPRTPVEPPPETNKPAS